VTNRRDFLRTVVAGAAGSYLMNRGGGDAVAAGFQAQPARRQLTVGGRRVRVIDMHAHCAIPVEDIVKGTPLAGSGGAGNLGLGPKRLQLMDQQGVDMEVLSIHRFWHYAADRDLARRIVQAHNEGLAEWVAAHPDRFVGLASVALQYPDLAAEQLQDGVERLGLRGASIPTNMNGEDLSLPKYDPFWAKAAELGLPIFTHPGGASHLLKEHALDGRGDLGNIIGNPLDTTYFLSRLIFDGTLDKFPGLCVFGSHAGGYLPSYLGRTEVACEIRGNANCANTKKPSEYLKSQILVDTMVFSQEGLRHLVAEMGAGQVVYGTDTPFGWPSTLDLVLDAPFLSDTEKQAILSGNLMKRLRIDV